MRAIQTLVDPQELQLRDPPAFATHSARGSLWPTETSIMKRPGAASRSEILPDPDLDHAGPSVAAELPCLAVPP